MDVSTKYHHGSFGHAGLPVRGIHQKGKEPYGAFICYVKGPAGAFAVVDVGGNAPMLIDASLLTIKFHDSKRYVRLAVHCA